MISQINKLDNITAAGECGLSGGLVRGPGGAVPEGGVRHPLYPLLHPLPRQPAGRQGHQLTRVQLLTPGDINININIALSKYFEDTQYITISLYHYIKS